MGIARESSDEEPEPDDGGKRKIYLMNAFLDGHPTFSNSRLLRVLCEIGRHSENMVYSEGRIIYSSPESYIGAYNSEQIVQMRTAVNENSGTPRTAAVSAWMAKYSKLFRKEWNEVHTAVPA